VIITGGAQGIGRATALVFAKNGANVFVGDNNTNALSELQNLWSQQKQKEKYSGTITTVEYDAQSCKSAELLAQKALSAHSRVDVIFNNVGIQTPKVPIHDLAEKDWDFVFNVNMKSIFYLLKYCLPTMIKQKSGTIINNASIHGVQSQIGQASYGASKGGIIALSRQMACDYGRYNIRVNAVSPGPVRTDLMEKNTPNLPEVISNIPLFRLGEVTDIANLVYFLASEKSGWITGQNIVIDGGITIKGAWHSL